MSAIVCHRLNFGNLSQFLARFKYEKLDKASRGRFDDYRRLACDCGEYSSDSLVLTGSLEQVKEFFNRPKLLIEYNILQTPQTPTASDVRIRFDVVNNGKNTATNIRALVTTVPMIGVSVFEETRRLKWTLEGGTESWSAEFGYLEGGALTWFSKAFDAKLAGTKYQYRVNNIPIGLYASGERILRFGIELVGARGLHAFRRGSILANASKTSMVQLVKIEWDNQRRFSL